MNQIAQRQTEHGNALFIILIAVALFGALSYTVSNMMNSGSTDPISKEKSKLYANEILDYARSTQLAVQNVRITSQCSDTEISFENSTVAGYTNAGAPSDNSCDIFDLDGGAMSYIVPSDDWLDIAFSAQSFYQEWFFSGNTCIENLGGSDTDCHTDGIDNSELVLFIPYVKSDICLQINGALGVYPDSNNIWSVAETKFTGSYGQTGRIDGTTAEFIQGCVQSTGTYPANGSYVFYQVLLPR